MEDNNGIQEDVEPSTNLFLTSVGTTNRRSPKALTNTNNENNAIIVFPQDDSTLHSTERWHSTRKTSPKFSQ